MFESEKNLKALNLALPSFYESYLALLNNTTFLNLFSFAK